MVNPYIQRKVDWSGVSVTIKAETYVDVVQVKIDKYGVRNRSYESCGKLDQDKTIKNADVSYEKYTGKGDVRLEIKTGKIIYIIQLSLMKARDAISVTKDGKPVLLI